MRTGQRPNVTLKGRDCQLLAIDDRHPAMAAHTASVPSMVNRTIPAPSRGALQRHDGQVPSFAREGELTRQSDSRLAPGQRHRLGAARASRPSCPWFKPRLLVHWTEAVADFIGSSAAERRVGPMAVVPGDQFREFSLEGSSPQRHQREPCDALLEREDQSLDHGDAAVLADRAEPRTHTLPSAPRFEFVTGKLGTLVRNQMPGLRSYGVDHAAQEGTHHLGGWLSLKKGDAHDPPGVMVQYHADPPSKRPALRQRHVVQNPGPMGTVVRSICQR